ncbi:hypothetical protein [Pseudomonas protegens]|uniref:hypothetical protein n=1 Tax=Pseudomonas protegens TaxID=380021 RepID=UPI0027780E27|nr:hypothetical protein [Pseudomonas protegens]MDP9518787.1 hypothetical protein [Pseudomonas protegens]
MLKVTSNLSGLKKLQKNVEELGRKSQISGSELFTDSFVAAHSSYADMDALLAAVGVTTEEEFKAMSDAIFDAFLQANTDFESWVDMQQKAVAEYAKAKLMEGLKR